MKISEGEIARAKKFPIMDLIAHLKPKKVGRTQWRIRCMFHADSDDSPNLIIFPETNTFHCFACGKWGDSITMFTQLKMVDFKTAIKELNKS